MKTLERSLIFVFHFQMFEVVDITANMNKTTSDGMNPTMKMAYIKSLLENAREQDVWNQFGKAQTITHGKTAEWRKFNTFAPAIEPLVEGVVPPGSTFGMTTVVGEISQHGDYTPISDVLELTSFDDTIFGATEEMGAAAGRTMALLTRNHLLTGKGVAYASKEDGTAVTARTGLDKTAILTPTMVNRAATYLKKMNAPTINGYYVAIIHPSVAEDLRETQAWKDFHKYNDVQKIFQGEIGELHKVKFIESTSAKVFADGNGSGKSVYATMFFGRDAWGKIELEGGGMELIIHDKREIGGPIDQFSTVGYKFTHGTAILYPERLLRVESCSSFYDDDEN